jgi:hypothetical protein
MAFAVPFGPKKKTKLMNKALLISFFVLLSCSAMQAQLGGLHTYEFLNLPASARITALGGTLITVQDDDANLAVANPAALNPSVHQQLAFNHSFHVADISHGYASYAHHFDKPGLSTHFGVQYINYGDFDQTNVLGQVEGSFGAAEYAIGIGASKSFYERITLGANLKLVTSQLESYSSLGLTSDLAAMYRDTARRFVASIVFKNAGTQLSTYRADNREELPFEIQVGISKKLRYLPFRFSIIYRHLNRWNIIYDDPNAESSTLFFGEVETERSNSSIWFDNFFRHFVFSGEFLIGKHENFRVRAGYNHFMRKELSVDNFGSLAGFSFGAGIKVYRFRLDYGFTSYHLGGGLNHLSISTNIKEFQKKGKRD